MSPERQNLILGAVDRMFDQQVAFLAALVRQPSDNPPGDCAPHAAMTADLLEQMGLRIERHPVPAETVRAQGMISVTNLIHRQNFGAGGPTVALNAHGDVVPPGEGWSVDPYGAVIRDGKMYGRGVAVSKSDFATYIFAVRALTAVADTLVGCVETHLTYDEEIGGLLGPGWLLRQGLSHPDYVISAGFTYNVVVAHNGCLHLEVRVEGKSAHAARPDTGVDALAAANQILTALYAEREKYVARRSKVAGIDHPTLVVGLIEGGVNTNVVPDVVTFRVDRRIIPEENPEAVETELRSVIAAAAARIEGVTVKMRQILLARPLASRPGQERLTHCLQAHARAILGEEIPANGVPIYTDARLYSEAGAPTVLFGAGPRSLLEANGHRADEQLVLEDMRRATQIIALTLADLLQGP